MKKNSYLIYLLVILFGLSFPAAICRAGVAKPKCFPKSLQAVEFLTGFTQSKIQVKGNYRTIPLMVDLDFSLKSLVQKLGFDYKPLLQFQLESGIAPVYSPDANVEFRSAFLLKIGLLPADRKFQPFILAGPGLSYMTQHTREQSTQFNFVEYGGVGAHYFFRKNIAFTVEYRFRHLSNSGIDHPNHGINSHFALVGCAYQF